MNHTQASTIEHDEVAKILNTDLVHGLTSYEARVRLKQHGRNTIEEDANSNTVPRLIYQSVLDYLALFMSPLMQLLLLSAVVSAVAGDIVTSLSILLSTVVVCTIAFVQNRRADRSLEKLGRQMPDTCTVIRENQAHEIEASCLVPGDIVELAEGQRVPADVRLYEMNSNFLVNEANLTGDTLSQTKIVAATARRLTSALSGEAQLSVDGDLVFQNLALMGTIVEAGSSRGLVICTGKATRYGQVYCLLKSTSQPMSPLQINIDRLSIHLVIVSLLVIGLVSILGIVQQRDPSEIAFYAVSLAVTAIPEGLPVVVASIMALSVLRLSRNKTIVKRLQSVESLGCTQVLCADKTGTLTRNDMTLTDIVTSELHSLSSSELEELNQAEFKKHMTFNRFGGKMYSIGRLMEVGTLCNNATYDPRPARTTHASSGHYIGQATECAILDASLRMGFGDSRTKFDRLHEIPFSSATRRMAVRCRRLDLPGNGPMYYVKGAWEEILQDCSHYYESGLVKARSDEVWREYARICTALGSQGLRVLALATGLTLDQLTFVGVVGIYNAPREGMAASIAKMRRHFQLDVKMITGDSRPTALSVGRELGLLAPVSWASQPAHECRRCDTADTLSSVSIGSATSSETRADDELSEGAHDDERYSMSGAQMEKLLESGMDDYAIALEICSKSVFYRVNPMQKAAIISQLQRLDKVVAMAGDGVNDVVSMKRANLSLVMGSGADVCKEIADIIIVDDNLGLLDEAILEGKGIYYKIQSFMSYQISMSLALLALITLAFATKTDAPFSVTQLLFLNLLADGLPGQSLGVERANERDLHVSRHDPILNRRLLFTIAALALGLFALNGGLYFYMLDDGQLDSHAKSLLFACFVFCSIFAALSLRSKVKTIFETKICGNKELLYCIGLIIVILMIILQVRPVSELFQVDQIPALELIYLFLYSASILVIMDVFKLACRLLDFTKQQLIKCDHNLGLDAAQQVKRTPFGATGPAPTLAETAKDIIKSGIP